MQHSGFPWFIYHLGKRRRQISAAVLRRSLKVCLSHRPHTEPISDNIASRKNLGDGKLKVNVCRGGGSQGDNNGIVRPTFHMHSR